MGIGRLYFLVTDENYLCASAKCGWLSGSIFFREERKRDFHGIYPERSRRNPNANSQFFFVPLYRMKQRQNTDVINIDREILGGTPVFRGTRVPIQTLFDYLEGNYSLDEFLDDFPTVKKKQALALLKSAEKLVVA